MKTPTLSTTILTLVVGLPLVGGCSPGGCPWTEAGEVTVSPARACLSLAIDDSEEAAGGCVNPVLVGHNDCAETLTFAAEVAEDGQLHAFEPGAAVELELELENDAIRTETDEGFDWHVPAALGAEAVEVRFRTWLD